MRSQTSGTDLRKKCNPSATCAPGLSTCARRSSAPGRRPRIECRPRAPRHRGRMQASRLLLSGRLAYELVPNNDWHRDDRLRLCVRALDVQVCAADPRLVHRIKTSLIPISGTATSSSHRPGSARAFTIAVIRRDARDTAVSSLSLHQGGRSRLPSSHCTALGSQQYARTQTLDWQDFRKSISVTGVEIPNGDFRRGRSDRSYLCHPIARFC
jgi:hypothetical protein